jgi:glycosyltransferase involved in cell wall biosynthesis
VGAHVRGPERGTTDDGGTTVSSRALRLVVDARFVSGGGIGTYLQELVPRLARLRDHWHITALGDGGALRALGWSGLPNVSLHDFGAAHYGIAEQVGMVLKIPSGTDVFWAPHYNFPVLARIPVVVTIHDVCHLARPEATTSELQRAYARFMHDRVGHSAAAVLCVSEFTKRELHRLVRRVACPVTVTPEAVDDSWFATQDSRTPKSIEGPYLVYVGNFKRHKNVARLVRAFGRVTQRVPHQLVLAGRTAGMNSDPAVDIEVRALGDRVRIVGEASGTELRALVRGADAFVTASLYEGFGLPALEAMAAGTPCMVSRAGSLPEVCGDAAVYCDPENEQSIADAIVRIVTDNAERDRLRTLGVSRAKTFSWDRCAATTADVLEGARR